MISTLPMFMLLIVIGKSILLGKLSLHNFPFVLIIYAQ